MPLDFPTGRQPERRTGHWSAARLRHAYELQLAFILTETCFE
jgi:hypothetical protein